MSKALVRLEKLERAVGIGEPCEACEIWRDYIGAHAELIAALGIPPEAVTGEVVEDSCLWCEATVRADRGDTPKEIIAMVAEMDALRTAGRVCAPEYDTLHAAVNEYMGAARRDYYGEHFPRFEALFAEYSARLDAFKDAPLPYLCRVPGCECEYPKTLAEWHKNVTENGYRVRGMITAA